MSERWRESDMAEVMDFLFAEFAEGTPVEVLRAGTFVDRNGKTVEVAEGDLEAFAANFAAGAAGQEVPIDVNHEKGEAAGWVRELRLDEGRLVAVPEWNELGKRLVGERIYRYVSATIDLAKKVIKAISLVNFPAVKGLKPVELSEGVYRLEEGHGLVEQIVARLNEILGKREDEVEFVIRQEGEEWCLYSSDGSRKLGCYPTREGAVRRERQVQYFKNRRLGDGEFEGEWAELQGNIRAIINKWRSWAGSHTACVRGLRGKPGIGDAEALCAWLHKQAEGKWPAEGSEYEPTVVELEALAIALSDVIAERSNDMTDEERAKLEEEIREKIVAEMAEKEKTVAELTEEIRTKVEAEMAEKYERRKVLVEFAAELCSGDTGLSARPEEVVEFLETLPEEQVEKAKGLLKSKVVDFTEHGSSQDGKAKRKALPTLLGKELRKWVDAEQSIAEFFEVNKDVLGEMGQYDLSEFEKE